MAFFSQNDLDSLEKTLSQITDLDTISIIRSGITAISNVEDMVSTASQTSRREDHNEISNDANDQIFQSSESALSPISSNNNIRDIEIVRNEVNKKITPLMGPLQKQIEKLRKTAEEIKKAENLHPAVMVGQDLKAALIEERLLYPLEKAIFAVINTLIDIFKAIKEAFISAAKGISKAASAVKDTSISTAKKVSDTVGAAKNSVSDKLANAGIAVCDKAMTTLADAKVSLKEGIEERKNARNIDDQSTSRPEQ